MKKKSSDFEIADVMKELGKTRRVFVSEADFQLAMAMIIKKLYDVEVRLEYPFVSDGKTKYIDILVLYSEKGKIKGIPIELKYKTKGCKIKLQNEQTNLKETFDLREHSAKNYNCYYYFKDIERIETIRDEIKDEYEFQKGYTVFLTNDLCYTKKPNGNAAYAKFSLHGDTDDFKDNVNTKKFENHSNSYIEVNEEGYKWTKKCELSAKILGPEKYPKVWKKFSTVEDNEILNPNSEDKKDDVKTFIYLANEIKNIK